MTYEDYVAKHGFYIANILNRLDRKYNYTAIIQGSKEERSGVGKSWMALSLAEVLTWILTGKRFKIEQVAFTGDEFLNVASDLGKKGVLIFDDVGVDFSSRTWWDEINLVISKTLETYRYKHLVTFLTVPHKSMIDKIGRMMAHQLVVVYDRGKADVYNIHVGRLDGKELFPKIGTIYVDPPTPELTKAYEKRKDKAHTALYKQGIMSIKARKEKERGRGVIYSMQEYADMVKRGVNQDGKPTEYKHKEKISTALIMDGLGIGISKAKVIAQLCK